MERLKFIIAILLAILILLVAIKVGLHVGKDISELNRPRIPSSPGYIWPE